MFGYDRWYFLDVVPSRKEAVEVARKRRATEEPGSWVYRIRRGRNGWTIEKAARMGAKEMEHTRKSNRKLRETESGAGPAG